ncbi:MAG: VWA domain-containing protein [Candidatus Bipolaricaulota bacterium]
MKRRASAVWFVGSLALLALLAAVAGILWAESATYAGVTFPTGDAAFADRVIEYVAASCVRDAHDDPEAALGPPDAYPDGCHGCNGCDTNAVALGFRVSELDARGVLVVEFVDNVLVDGVGNDLFVYITNGRPCRVEVSADGFQFYGVGEASSCPTGIDIQSFVPAGLEFRFVRLTDVPADEDHSNCPGASVDAIGAMGPAQQTFAGTASGALNVQPVGELAFALQGGPTSLLIVMDCSSSMAEEVDGEVKIEIAKDVILDLLDDLPTGSNVGLRYFQGCGNSQILVPVVPLNDRAAFRAAVQGLVTRGATPIAYTLDQVRGDFAAVTETKLVLLITDGMETCKGDPVKSAKALIEGGYDLKINVVGFDIGRDSEARDQLMAIAAATGGAFLAAENRDELRDALSLSAPFSYSVFDLEGNLVYTGRLGEASGPELAVGTYQVVIGTQPAITGTVVVSEQQTTTVTIERRDGQYVADFDG